MGTSEPESEQENRAGDDSEQGKRERNQNGQAVRGTAEEASLAHDSVLAKAWQSLFDVQFPLVNLCRRDLEIHLGRKVLEVGISRI
jgi:hypothetical protein